MNILEAFEKSGEIRVYDSRNDSEWTLFKKDQTTPIPLRIVLLNSWEPVIEPLTFDRIKAECVPGRTLFVDEGGGRRLYLGFNRDGCLVTDNSTGSGCIRWDEDEIKNWQISSEKWEG